MKLIRGALGTEGLLLPWEHQSPHWGTELFLPGSDMLWEAETRGRGTCRGWKVPAVELAAGMRGFSLQTDQRGSR